MKCHFCKIDKLRREFPYEALTDNCDHAPLHCLRCTTEFVEKKQCCSICHRPVALDNPQYQECVDTLKRLFPDMNAPQATPSTTLATPNVKEHITVSIMGGEVTIIPYNVNMTVEQLQTKIKQHFGTRPEQQRLLYLDKELKAYHDGKMMTLQHYNVQPFSTINLVVILYNIPDSFDEVIFDLFWGYPASGIDYLDASVLLYGGTSFNKEVVDYRHRHSTTCPAVCHSGDVMDSVKCLGHHTIKVKIKSLPESINKLFFTLSAWNSPNISKYPNPSLRFFDARFPDKQLCDDSMNQAAYSQAIVMCSLCKIQGQWKVLSLKKLSNGNAKDYSPLQSTIQQLILQGLS